MSNILVLSSIVFPIIVGIFLLLFKNRVFRTVIVTFSMLASFALFIFTFIYTPFETWRRIISNFDASSIIVVCDYILLVTVILISIKHKRVLPIILTVFQAVPLIFIDFTIKPMVEEQFKYNIFLCDHLSMVMMFLILVIGPLIALFALRYMDDYEHHNKIKKSRQPGFFFIIFLFLGGMSGIVLSNNILNVFFFWELTTLCSFLLIGFTQTKEAIDNAFRALWMNLLGGVAFIVGIFLIFNSLHTFKIDQILAYGYNYENTKLILIPLCLIAIAGFTKSAQFPFQSWLLGAMVAPTPVSALLHSSTMVKAGVYLLVRFSPLFMDTGIGYAISVIGGFSFFCGSALAITQSNGKRVLAYSTIANLGLIVATAGIGTPLAVTAAILLIIFHAVSKGLLFLCVGTIEHAIGSRDVEDMDGIVSKMPLVGILTAIGMFSMLLPPFGVIITKLLTIEAAAQIPALLILLSMGSALTLVFWTKWMGKILTISNTKQKRLEKYSFSTVFPLSMLAILIMVISVGIVGINNYFVSPYIVENWGMRADINLYSMMLIPIFIAILCIVSLIPIFFKKTKNYYRDVYLCGENTSDGEFVSTADAKCSVLSSNYYLEQFFDEKQFTVMVNILAVAFIFYMFGVAV